MSSDENAMDHEVGNDQIDVLPALADGGIPFDEDLFVSLRFNTVTCSGLILGNTE